MTIGLAHYLTVAAILFTIGVFGIFLNRKNVIIILMSIELMLLAVNLNFVAFSAFLGDLIGQVFALFVLTVAAGEAAIGLAMLVISAILSWIALWHFLAGGMPFKVGLFRWVNSGALTADWVFRIDTLTAVMLVVVTTVSSLVHIYSIGYMAHDPHQPRFFSYLS